ncbi:MAG: hypothetical protein J3K34DRAFT_448956, partial [Monoraphidium minutum]
KPRGSPRWLGKGGRVPRCWGARVQGTHARRARALGGAQPWAFGAAGVALGRRRSSTSVTSAPRARAGRFRASGAALQLLLRPREPRLERRPLDGEQPARRPGRGRLVLASRLNADDRSEAPRHGSGRPKHQRARGSTGRAVAGDRALPAVQAIARGLVATYVARLGATRLQVWRGCHGELAPG